jgi:hypothetical protein
MDLVPGGSSISCVLPDSTLTNIPWRRLNVKYANSEIYFDIVEEMDAIYDRYALRANKQTNKHSDTQTSKQAIASVV